MPAPTQPSRDAQPGQVGRPSWRPTVTWIRRGRGTILLVEDAGRVRHATATILRRLGYRVVEAGNGREALALRPGERANVVLLLADMVMPGT
jgi:PleD family two-component response regulator